MFAVLSLNSCFSSSLLLLKKLNLACGLTPCVKQKTYLELLMTSLKKSTIMSKRETMHGMGHVNWYLVDVAYVSQNLKKGVDLTFWRNVFAFCRMSLQSIFAISSRLAGTCSALVLATKSYFVHLPMILYGIFSIAASGCVYLLPETFRLPLPDTIEDIEKR